jgi:hypothetical protein
VAQTTKECKALDHPTSQTERESARADGQGIFS